LFLAFVLSLVNGVSMCDEGSGSGGYIWLMLGTLPVGLVMILIGSGTWIYRKISK
jgi:hypothetical protein